MREDTCLTGRQWHDRFVHGNVDHKLAEVDAAAEAVHGLPDAWVSLDEHALIGAFVVEDVEERCAVPLEMLADLADVIDDDRMIRADVRHRRTANAQTTCCATVPAHQLPVVIDGGDRTVRADGRPLDEVFEAAFQAPAN